MKASALPIGLFFTGALTLSTLAQGTFLFDQQSSTDESTPGYFGTGVMQQMLPPFGQSFTPTLSSIGFIRLKLSDGNINDGLGATVFVNLRSGSISGPIIGTTDPVSMPSLFLGVAQFTLRNSVPLTPTSTYYLEPVLQSGGTWCLFAGSLSYPGGSFYENGQPVLQTDLWFREGTVVPEPSTFALLALGASALVWRRRSRG